MNIKHNIINMWIYIYMYYKYIRENDVAVFFYFRYLVCWQEGTNWLTTNMQP